MCRRERIQIDRNQLQAQWHMPHCYSKTKAEGLLKSRSSRPVWGTEQEPVSKKKKKKKRLESYPSKEKEIQ
jgi:hypothetical protein